MKRYRWEIDHQKMAELKQQLPIDSHFFQAPRVLMINQLATVDTSFFPFYAPADKFYV